MINFWMTTKGFTELNTNLKTPNNVGITEKPLIPTEKKVGRVDINVLKSRIQVKQKEEYKKDLAIFVLFLLALTFAGIYLSAEKIS